MDSTQTPTIVSSIKKEPYSASAMAKALLGLSKNPELAEKIEVALDAELQQYDQDKTNLDAEADIAPTEYWLGIIEGNANAEAVKSDIASLPPEQTAGEKQETASGETVKEKLSKYHLIFVAEFNQFVLEIASRMIERDAAVEGSLTFGELTSEALDHYDKTHPDSEYSDLVSWGKGSQGSFSHCLGKLWGELQPMSTEDRAAIVAELTQDVNGICTIRKDIQAPKEQVRAFFDSLSVRCKFVMCVGMELEYLDGVNISCYAKMMNELRSHADEYIQEIRRHPVYSKDSEIAFMCNMYELALQVQEA